jgi:hypothetical protein
MFVGSHRNLWIGWQPVAAPPGRGDTESTRPRVGAQMDRDSDLILPPGGVAGQGPFEMMK